MCPHVEIIKVTAKTAHILFLSSRIPAIVIWSKFSYSGSSLASLDLCEKTGSRILHDKHAVMKKKQAL